MIKIRSNEIKMVELRSLKMKSNNRNHHGQDQIEMLAEHYKYQGFRNPLIVSNQSGEIVSGNGRYLAAVRAGLKTLPVIFQDFDSPEQEYSYHVADNSLHDWSRLDLSSINNDLQDLGPDFDLKMLGINNFTLDFNQLDFNPNAEEKEKKSKICPHCGETI